MDSKIQKKFQVGENDGKMSSTSDSIFTPRDEVLVDMETLSGKIVLKRTVRSGIVAIQYNGD